MMRDYSDPWYAERGRMIHLATALYDYGTLDESSLDYRIVPYLEAFKSYREQFPFIETDYPDRNIEIVLGDHVYDYAGTLDRNDIEIKAGKPEPWHRIQLAAYQNLATLNGLDKVPKEILYLNAGEHETLIPELARPNCRIVEPKPKELREDLNTFLCGLRIVKWKRENIK